MYFFSHQSMSLFSSLHLLSYVQMVVLMDPMEDPDDVLRANRSREKTYMFDVAFDCSATQEEVYRATTKGLIEGLISGFNATVFAYGPTGCGKTYTMLGTDTEPGIYVRTLNDLFRAIEETSDDMQYSVSMSYLEIYNEMIRDLLNPSSGFLDLREDSKGEIQVAGITEVSTINAQEIMELLMKGNKQRTQEPTAANQTSSRSHAVLQVAVRQQSRCPDVLQEVRFARLFMIDLAGSERAAQTQNRGQRLKEGAHINRSLLALGNCINALSEKHGNKYVNYRDSKLTRLLKDSLGGNSRTIMIAHISPASVAFEESRNTLSYADRAKSIRTRVKRNLFNVPYHIAQYTSIIADLRGEIQRLKSKIAEQSRRADIRNVQAEVQAHASQQSRAETEQLRKKLLEAFRQQMDVRRSLVELENSDMDIQAEASKHLLAIADWEKERSRRARKWRAERRKESFSKEENEKELDSPESPPDGSETREVLLARENLVALIAEQRKVRKQKVALERSFQELRERAQHLEDQLPQRASSEEQREVLSLLCKVHELEMENAGMQSRAVLRDSALRRTEAVVQRFERHRELCDKIIQQQRRFIDDRSLLVSPQLQDLYEMYARELDDRNLDRLLALNHIALRTLKVGLVPLTSSHFYKFGNLEPCSIIDNNRVFKTSPHPLQMKNSVVMTPPPIHINGRESYERLAPSMRSRDPLAHASLRRTERLEILNGVKDITVKAARRRSKALETDALRIPPPLDPTKHKSSLSLSEAPPRGPPRQRGRRPSPELRHATSDDNLSSSTGEGPSRQGTWTRPRHRPHAPKNPTPGEQDFEARRRKRRSRSFEVTGQAVSSPNPHPHLASFCGPDLTAYWVRPITHSAPCKLHRRSPSFSSLCYCS
uniref:Kinesin-like protein n=1 Tax=Scleropages formosus TaxID=113540 RepID=A0A8C9TIH7_SCLFO